MQTICVFCGSSSGSDPAYASASRELGAELARRKLALVYGGGRVGLMGELAASVTAAGGQVIGIIPHALSRQEIAYTEASELIVVDTMHTRKAMMADRADAFIALPGGFGTFDELFEILTWAQLGIHRKPIGLLNVNGFFTPLLAWLDQVVAEGLLKRKHRDLLLAADLSSALIDMLAAYIPPPPVTKFIEPGDR